MIRKLLYFVRSLSLSFFSTSKKRSFIPNLKLLCLGMFLINFISSAQTTTQTITATGSGTFVIPCGVSSITVETWGGGGAGGGSTSSTALGGGGGAGGTYASSIITVSSGQSISYSVGAGAPAATAVGARGGDTWFVNNTTLLAKGGNGGTAPNYTTVAGGLGTTTGSIGGTLVKGADGSNATLTQGGAGGRGGNNGGVGGAARSNSGNGGDGNSGSQPGGGGGGAYVGNGTDRYGGSGGNGQIKITYNTPPVLTVSNAGPDQYKNTTFTLAANTPGTGNTGTWSIVSGPSLSTSQFAGGDTSNPTSVFTPSGAGTWTLNWTITNGCGTSTDQVLITNCSGNLITNGDFSTLPAGSGWTYAVNSKGDRVEVLNESVYFGNSNSDNTAELDYQASLGQSVTVIPGVSYTLSFVYARRPLAPANVAVDVKIIGGSSPTSKNFTTNDNNSTPQIGTFTFIPSSSSILIEFYNSLSTTGQTLGAIIDNIVLLPTSQEVPFATTNPKGKYKTLTACSGASVQLDVDNISASDVTYLWSGSAAASFSSTTIKNPKVTFSSSGIVEKVTVVVTKAGGCASSPSSTFVYLLAAPTITTAATPAVVTAVCPGVSTTTMPYTGTTDNPTSYSIDWATLTDQGPTTFNFLAGGGTLTGISIPAGTVAGTYTGTMTIYNANGCTGTLAITMTINPNLAASVSIAASPSGAICVGTPVTFTATPTFGGTTPTYQWYNGLTAVGTGSTYSSSTLTNGAAIKVVMTSNASPCLTGSPATSNTITMTVNPNLSAVGITPNTAQSICGLNSGTLLTAAETGGNGVTLRQWGKRSVSGGTITNITGQNGPTFTPTGTNLGNGNWLIVCTSTPSCGTAMVSNEVSVSVNPDLAASVSIAASPSGAICAGTPVTFTATPVNGGTTPTYQWYNGLTAVGTGSTYSSSTLANGAAIKVVMTSNASPCLIGSPATSNTITMTVNPTLSAVGITPNGGQALCAIGTGTLLTVAETGGNTITSRQWGKRLVSGGAITNISGQNAQTFTPTGANLGVGDWLIVCTSTPSCGSAMVSNEVSVKVSPDIVASVTILASPSGTICSGTLVTFTATPINEGTAPTYQWYNGLTPVGTGLSTYSSSTLANADDIKVVMTSNATPCLAGSPATSNTITMSVNVLPGTPSPGTPVQPTCASPVGSVLLGNLPSTGTWTITQSGFASGTYPGTGSTYNVQNLAPGNYTFTVVGAANSCSSLASTNVTINAPTSKVWTGNADANWSNPANWNPAVTPSASDCIVIPDLTAVPNIPSIQGTGVVANAYTITVSDKASLTVNSKNTLRVVGSVTVAPLGSLVFQDQASLVQTTNATNTGNITYNRNTDLVRRYDFTYWSTPITNTASPYKLSDLSPNTLLDKYTSYNSPASSWDIYLNGLKDMEPAVGYSVRAPQSFSLTVPAIYPAVFTGVPNNGDYSVPIYAAKWSLVGNPYPSAIDAEEFININHFASPSVDVGALYFWTHNSPPSSTPSAGGSYDYTSNDYAVFTLSGSTRTGAKRPDGTYDPAPTGQIASCQSFFMLASVPGIVKFTNDMRIDGGNDQFYKTTKSKAIEKNRVWLNLTSNKGAFKQILVGYIEGATNEWDVNFDATANNGNSFIDFYSINESEKLAIQGRALPFADTDRIPLGYKTTVAGDFIIEIDRVDGLFNNQAVYLEDRVTGKVTDLKAGNYTFTTAIGTFADRFTIVYTKKTLGTGDFENLENSVFVSIKEETIKVTSTKETIKEITIYDINGQLLYNKKKIGVNELQIPNLQSSNQVLLVKVTLDNDFTTTKKIIFQ